MKYKLIYLAISSICIIPGVISLFLWGLKPSIDFVGGSLWEIQISSDKPVNVKSINELVVQTTAKLSSVQASGKNQYLLRFKELADTEKSDIRKQVEDKYGQINEIRFETVGPTLGKELLLKTVFAILIASVFILLYVGRQFKEKMYGVCAILAMFHDSLVILGLFSLLGHFFNVEVDTLFVTAVLTILSFSVHDTIVVYDRIRESVKSFSKAPFEDLVNKAITETMVRSLNNSLTIVFMLTALALLGGHTIRWFVVALLVGTISGTYSSPFVAAPLLVVWRKYLGKDSLAKTKSFFAKK